MGRGSDDCSFSETVLVWLECDLSLITHVKKDLFVFEQLHLLQAVSRTMHCVIISDQWHMLIGHS